MWSYPNPRNLKGTELCDTLIVCGNHVIIFSVKHSRLRGHPDDMHRSRWTRNAVENSIKQVYGAGRHLPRMERVIRSDGSEGLALPEPSKRKVHLVAVALGGDGTVPLSARDDGKGVVHVLDDRSAEILLEELDAISDFVDYLAAREEFVRSGQAPADEQREEDVLAAYLIGRRSFSPESGESIEPPSGLWSRLSRDPAFLRRKEADRLSYGWDLFIDKLWEDGRRTDIGAALTLDQRETAIRRMALENRFQRRVLMKCFEEFHRDGRSGGRMTVSQSGVAYVFLALPRNVPRDFRMKQLALRCFVACHKTGKAEVVGLATESYERDAPWSLDVSYLYRPDWSDEDSSHAEQISRELGYFNNPPSGPRRFEEYPRPDDDLQQGDVSSIG
ncbi:MAG: hypothetical protein RL885_03095 [Planctomycetota bacterium]